MYFGNEDRGKKWVEDYGEVALYLWASRGELHKYVTQADLAEATVDNLGNVTLHICEGGYYPEDYDHYMDWSYAMYAHTRRYQVTMPVDVLRYDAMRGFIRHRGAHPPLIERARYPELPEWFIEKKRRITELDTQTKAHKLLLEEGERVRIVSLKAREPFGSPVVDLVNHVHAMWFYMTSMAVADRVDGYRHPMEAWDAMVNRSTGDKMYRDGFTAEAELVAVPAGAILDEEMLREPYDGSWQYGDLIDYLALTRGVHLWGMDVVCLGAGVLSEWESRQGSEGSRRDQAREFVVFGEEYPGCRWMRRAKVGSSLTSAKREGKERPCFLLRVHGRRRGEVDEG
jgi:hypothetical protein